MAISLSDAWNESTLVQNYPVVSAKQVVNKFEEEEPESLREHKVDILPPIEKAQSNGNSVLLEMIISEMRETKKEESKRFTIYIVVACILFAVLLMYIDKLQCKVKDLSSNIHRLQWSNRNVYDMKAHMSEPFQWLN